LKTMLDVLRRNRLSPPLMQVFRAAHEAGDAARKIDGRGDAQERPVTGRRSRTRQAITESALRREVARDLDALLNATAMESTADMTEFPDARKSILNFGLPDISNRTIDSVGIRTIPAELRTSINHYEPRLAAATLQIDRDMSVDPAELKVRFVVRADLTCYPIQVPVEFVADIVESGNIVVNRL
jgi:type VI secretion system protein ImpF